MDCSATKRAHLPILAFAPEAARLRGEPVPRHYEFRILTRTGEERWVDFIAGQIVRIDQEAGKITLQHEPIPYLHLPAGTTTFRYVESRWLIGRRAGDRVRFRADRIDLTLRMTALVYVPG